MIRFALPRRNLPIFRPPPVDGFFISSAIFLTPNPLIPSPPKIDRGCFATLSRVLGALLTALPNCCNSNLLKFFTLFFIKFINILNGAFIKVPTTNLNASAAKPFNNIAALETAITITVIPVPTINKSETILNFNLFNSSTLPSDFNLINCNVCSTNQPPASISRKLVSLLKIPPAKFATRRTGVNNAN